MHKQQLYANCNVNRNQLSTVQFFLSALQFIMQFINKYVSFTINVELHTFM